MAILKHTIRDNTTMELELSLFPSEYYDPKDVGKWVKAKVAFRFWKSFPEIFIERSGQEIGDVENLIGEIRTLVKEDKQSFYFTPLEPDYSIEITKFKGYEDFMYSIVVILDITGSQATGVYCGNGPSIHFDVKGKELLDFADDLEKELAEVIKTYDSKK